MVLAYDWTVFAGTQGVMGHRRAERVFELTHDLRLPVVLFAEGGGGRPGDTRLGPTGLDMLTFLRFARLSGLAPTIGITSRFCFAGNAALLGCCDVIIGTNDANIGMSGPAMIEVGGLGVVKPTEIGPATVQSSNGVIDILVEDEAHAVAVAKKYVSYFQGTVAEWECAGQRLLRRAVPENRLRAYDVRDVITLLADTGSVLELRPFLLGQRHDHGANPRRGPAAGRDRKQSAAPRRRDRCRRCGKGASLHAALRRLRPADPVAVRHARLHGRPGRGDRGSGAALFAALRDRSEHRHADSSD
jgi:hypothetical protein